MEIVYAWMTVLTAAVSVYLLFPFFSRSTPALTAENRPDDYAGRTASSLKELEFDLAAGKMSVEDYETARSAAVAELAAALKQSGEQPAAKG